MAELRVGVLMGGFSSEREISLKSGEAVSIALRQLGYDVKKLDFKNKEELIQKLKQEKLNCVFNALHGRFGEDGKVQKILEDLKIAYTGSGPIASSLAMDKITSHKIFKANNIPVPDFRILTKSTLTLQNQDDIFFDRFPLVVKPAREGSSIGLSIVEDKDDLLRAINKAFVYDTEILVEEYIGGREITVGILEDNPLPVIEIVPKNRFYDFDAKYTTDATEYIVPAHLPATVTKKAQQLAQMSHKLLGCVCFSRTDMLFDETKGIVVLELNSIPGFTATSLLPKAAAACGISFTQLCERIILFNREPGFRGSPFSATHLEPKGD
ncbi:MAG: D-alanine--D-alanine ligase [Candidatus Omnitrophica bacterium]|nr:D-alanine--D-alanine ligase [Candidatus Omnitrophota bacterium]MBU1924659.1 D-alanine--D-alanine ligase [Candidatus Omnitrophota bacterium]